MIPLFRPSVSEKEIENIVSTLKGGWWGLGPKTKEFEEKFAEYVGAKYAVGVSSGTDALHLAGRAYGLKGKTVDITALTFVSTGLAPLYDGGDVRFLDINEETLNIDGESDADCVIPVHYAGRKAKATGKIIIEDCAHACGNKTVGENTSCWSFHAVKNLATGDGGMITTNDKDIYEKLLPMRWCGIDKSTWERSKKKYGWDYDIEDIGFKCHMNDLTASIGLAQLERLDEMNDKRRFKVLQYLKALEDVEFLELPEWDEDSSWHLFVVRTQERDRFIDYMLSQGISVGVHYKPLNTYSMFPQEKLPVTDRVWKTLATLPLFPDMTQREFDYIVQTIKDYEKTI